MNNLDQIVKKHLLEILSLPDIDHDTNLLESGMDSMNFIRLVVELEDQFDIEVDDEDIILENFETVNNICSILSKYLDEDN